MSNLGFWGLVVLALAYLPAALVAFPPAIVLTLAAGAFYDIVPATIAISLGSTLAAAVAFLVGRTVARGWVEAAWPNNLSSRRSMRPSPRMVSRSFCSPDYRPYCPSSSSITPMD